MPVFFPRAKRQNGSAASRDGSGDGGDRYSSGGRSPVQPSTVRTIASAGGKVDSRNTIFSRSKSLEAVLKQAQAQHQAVLQERAARTGAKYTPPRAPVPFAEATPPLPDSAGKPVALRAASALSQRGANRPGSSPGYGWGYPVRPAVAGAAAAKPPLPASGFGGKGGKRAAGPKKGILAPGARGETTHLHAGDMLCRLACHSGETTSPATF